MLMMIITLIITVIAIAGFCSVLGIIVIKPKEGDGGMVSIVMVSVFVAAFIIILIMSPKMFSNADSIIVQYANTACTSLKEQIAEKKNGYKTVVLPFTGFVSHDEAKLVTLSSTQNSDERKFYDCIVEGLVKAPQFKVFTRDKLDKALAELKIQMKDIFDPGTAKRVGKFVGADLIVIMEGFIGNGADEIGINLFFNTYNDIMDTSFFVGTFRVKMIVIDVETAEIKAMWNKSAAHFS